MADHCGIARVKALWQGPPSGAHPLGSAGPAIEAAWLERVRRATPASLDIPRVIKEGC